MCYSKGHRAVAAHGEAMRETGHMNVTITVKAGFLDRQSLRIFRPRRASVPRGDLRLRDL